MVFTLNRKEPVLSTVNKTRMAGKSCMLFHVLFQSLPYRRLYHIHIDIDIDIDIGVAIDTDVDIDIDKDVDIDIDKDVDVDM